MVVICKLGTFSMFIPFVFEFMINNIDPICRAGNAKRGWSRYFEIPLPQRKYLKISHQKFDQKTPFFLEYLENN